MFNSEIVYPTPCQALIPVWAKSSQILREYPLLLTTPLPPPSSRAGQFNQMYLIKVRNFTVVLPTLRFRVHPILLSCYEYG